VYDTQATLTHIFTQDSPILDVYATADSKPITSAKYTNYTAKGFKTIKLKFSQCNYVPDKATFIAIHKLVNNNAVIVQHDYSYETEKVIEPAERDDTILDGFVCYDFSKKSSEPDWSKYPPVRWVKLGNATEHKIIYLLKLELGGLLESCRYDPVTGLATLYRITNALMLIRD
jgi:hypothetical protein